MQTPKNREKKNSDIVPKLLSSDSGILFERNQEIIIIGSE